MARNKGENIKQYAKWKELNKQGLLLTPETIKSICQKYNYDAEKIGEYIISLVSASNIETNNEKLNMIFLEYKKN